MLPKYRFYVGKNIGEISFYANTNIDLITGERVDGSAWASSQLTVGSSKLYIDYKPDVKSNNYFCKYDKDRNYLGYEVISKIITIPDNVKYIVLVFNSANTGVSEIVKTDFLYNLYAVNPHYKELSKKYSKENGQEFFRVSLDGKINLFGRDYEIVAKSGLENKFVFISEKLNNNSKTWNIYYEGRFSKTDCKLDYEKKKCELKIEAIDDYTKILDNYDNAYNLIKLAPEVSKINIHKRSLLQVYVEGANSITNFFGGTYWEDDVNEVIDSSDDLVNKYHFAYIKAGNEFYVTGSRKFPEVNGVYAGTNGQWNQQNGYTCYFGTDTPNQPAYIYIKRNSDNVVLYRSQYQYIFTTANNCYIKRSFIMVNVNDSSELISVNTLFVYHIYARLLCDVNTIKDAEGLKNTYNLPIDDFVTDNRNYKKCIGINTGFFFCTSYTVDEPTKYGINDYKRYFTNAFIPATTGLGRALPISKNSWANASLWYVYDDFYEDIEAQLRKQYVLKDSYSIGAVIKALLKKIDPTISHEATSEYSQFLYGDTNPMGLDRFYVYITQKTNILKGNYDQAAQKAEISFEELMKMLRDCFRCYWYIDNYKLKIEHISFFMNGSSYSGQSDYQLNFNKLTDKFNKKLISYFQSEIEFEKSDLNQHYEFEWMDDVTDLFGGVTIDVESNYIQKGKTEEINIGQFSSDVDFMLFNPSNFSNDGFALLCPTLVDGTLSLPIVTVQGLIDENGDTYKAIIQNWYASWIYLQNLYMWDMPAQNIKSNTVNTLFVRDIKKCVKQTIKFISEEDLDELKLIKTPIGNGKIDEMSFNLNTRLAKVNLLYKPQ